jgi:hypothetical protein
MTTEPIEAPDSFQTEREVVLALAEGRLPSPVRYCRNTWAVVTLVEIGAHVRSDGEIGFRDRIWLSDRMLRRMIGTPVTDSADFTPQAVQGFIVHSWRDGSALKAVVRILPEQARQPDAAESRKIRGGKPHQSARLHVLDGDGDVAQLDAIGERIVIEHEPRFISHVTIT